MNEAHRIAIEYAAKGGFNESPARAGAQAELALHCRGEFVRTTS